MEKNSTLKILTYNTRLYEQGNKIGRQQRTIDENNFDSIMGFVTEWLEQDNSIVVLQEIPFICNETWKEHKLFEAFKARFPKESYDFIKNITSDYQIIMTVVVAKSGLIKKDMGGVNNNRCVSFLVVNSRLRFLAVHSHDAEELLGELGELSENDPDIILGDFNSGNYCKKNPDPEFKENRENYRSLLRSRGYFDLVGGKYTTQYNTSIDHVLVKREIETKCSEAKVYYDIGLSDHYPISFEIDLGSL